MSRITDWAWTVLIIPIVMLFQSKSDKTDVEALQRSIDRIGGRVDKIYEHLVGKK